MARFLPWVCFVLICVDGVRLIPDSIIQIGQTALNRATDTNTIPQNRNSIYEKKWDLNRPNDLLNARVEVYWPRYKKWYPGVVQEYRESSNEHKVMYEDGDSKWHPMSKRPFKIGGFLQSPSMQDRANRIKGLIVGRLAILDNVEVPLDPEPGDEVMSRRGRNLCWSVLEDTKKIVSLGRLWDLNEIEEGCPENTTWSLMFQQAATVIKVNRTTMRFKLQKANGDVSEEIPWKGMQPGDEYMDTEKFSFKSKVVICDNRETIYWSIVRKLEVNDCGSVWEPPYPKQHVEKSVVVKRSEEQILNSAQEGDRKEWKHRLNRTEGLQGEAMWYVKCMQGVNYANGTVPGIKPEHLCGYK